MRFKDANSLLTVVEEVRRSDEVRARNRARIDRLFNGEAPYTPQEQEENRIGTNVNFLEAANIAHGARGMYDRAFVQVDEYFSVKLDSGPAHKRQEWGFEITRWINRYLSHSPEYLEAQQQKFAQVVLHGPAQLVWRGPRQIIPSFHPIYEVMFPSKTYRDMRNLNYFQIYREFTVPELIEMANATPNPKTSGWNVPLVMDIIKRLQKEKIEYGNYSEDWRFPEKLVENVKADSGGYWGDKIGTVKAWDCFYLADAKGFNKPHWNRRIVLQNTDPADVGKSEFLFDQGDKSYGTDYRQIFAGQYADGNNVAPFRLHSIRSLGFLLYSIAHLSNRLQCRAYDAAFRETMTLFRSNGDGDRERPGLVNISDFGVIPDGLQMVTAQERYQVNEQFLAMMQGQTRQRMNENSAHYTNDMPDGTNREKTATQIIAESQAATALVSSMLGYAYTQEKFTDLEICRRLCVADNPDARRFRSEMIALGIPKEMLDVNRWEVTRNRQIGNGNKTIQIAIADKLMAIRPQLSPDAQRKVDRFYVMATVDDSSIARDLVPFDEKEVSTTEERAGFAWATLIDGKPVSLTPTINRVEYVQTLIKNLALELEQIEQTQEPPDGRRLLGLANVVQHLMDVVATLEQDPSLGELVKRFSDVLSQAMNRVEKMAKDHEARAKENGTQSLSAETQAKIQAMLITAQSKARISEAASAQKREHKELAFQEDLRRKEAQNRAQISAADAQTAAGILRENLSASLTPKSKPK